MLLNHEFTQCDDASEWAERSESWIGEANKFEKKRKRRERNSNPLILTGHGASLRIENGALVIRDGFTHYPQQQARHRYFRGNLDLPSRILLLDGSGTLSFDVLSWLAEQGVALARVKWTGEVAIVASGTGYAADPAKVRWQTETRDDPCARLAFSIDLLRGKFEQSIVTLESCFVASPKRDRAIAKIVAIIAGLTKHPPADMKMLRALEAVAASAYFSVWQALTVKWTGTNRRPVPEEWLRFTGRTSTANGTKSKNVNASHPVNAILNYAYAVRHGQLQIETIANGYDSTIGIMHHGRRGLPAYIFDLIEPERPNVDAAIIAFVQSRSFCAVDFVIRSDGVCRLSPQLARAVANISSASEPAPIRAD